MTSQPSAEDAVDVLGGEALLERHDVHVRVQRLERPLRGGDLRLAEAVGRVHDLALEVRLVDDVGVDDAERADAGGREVERRRRAEPARADEQDARVEQALLPVLADLGDEEVAAVARALLGREHARDGDVEAVALPVGEAAGEVDDVLVAEVLEHLRGERRARSGRAVDDERAGSCRGRALRCAARAARDRCRSRRGCGPRPTRRARGRRRRATRPTTSRRSCASMVEISSISLSDLCQQLAVRRHYFRNYSFGALAIVRRCPRSVVSRSSSAPSRSRRSRSSAPRCSPPTATRPARRRRRPSRAARGTTAALVRARLPDDPEAQDLTRAARAVPSGATTEAGRALREARLARGEGRRGVRGLAGGHARPARAAREAVPRGRGRAAPPRPRAAVGERGRPARGVARRRRGRAGHAVRDRRRATSSIPSLPRGLPAFIPSFTAPAAITKLPPARQLEALRRAAERGGVREQLLYGVGLQRVGRPVSAARVFDQAAQRFPDDVEAQVAGAVGAFDKDAPERAFGRLGPLSKTLSERAERALPPRRAAPLDGPDRGRRAPVPARVEGAAGLAARARGGSLPRDDPPGALLRSL